MYDSYVDFWRLVEAAGFPIVYIDDMDLDRENCTYIFTPMNGEVPPYLSERPRRRANVVWWNLERPEDGTHAASVKQLDGLVDAIWVSDRFYATLHPRYRYVQLAGHRLLDQSRLELAGLTSKEAIESLGFHVGKQWDICTLAYLWGRREDAVRKLEAQGLTFAPAVFGQEQQDRIVPACRVMLNLHQYMELPIIAPLRFAVAASYRIPIISETFHDGLARNLVIASAPIHRLVGGLVKSMLQPGHHETLDIHGEALYQRLCVQTNFRREVERAVDDVRAGR